MAKPDVRVRLSAEGVAEVVGALKRVQAEGQKASSKSMKGFGGLNRVLGGTTNLLAGLGVALGVHQLTRFIGKSIEAADQINKMGEKVGATAENLSALNYAARLSDSNLDQLAGALVRMNKFLGQAEAGNMLAISSLKDLGLAFDSFRGMDSVEIFALLSEKIVNLGSVIRSRKSSMDIFGRAGAMLLPTMSKLAEDGFGAVIEEARELGIIMDEDLAAASERIKDDFEILKMQSEVLGAHFVSGFAPQISEALSVISGDLGATTSVWKDFGDAVGTVIKWVVAVVSAGFDAVGSMIGGLAVSVRSIGIRLKGFVAGDMEGARKEIEEFNEWADEELNSFAERMRARFDVLTGTPAAVKARAGARAGSLAGEDALEIPAELAAKRATALQAALDRDLAMAKTHAALRRKEERRTFDEGLSDVETYYLNRQAIVAAAYEEELRVLEEKKGLLDDLTDPAIRLQEEKKIDSLLAKSRLENENAIAELLFEERKAVRELVGDRLELERELLEMQGKRIEAERLGFDERIRQADLLLRQQGVADAQREATLARLRSGLEAGVDFSQAQQDAETALADYAAARDEIEAQAREGLMGQIQAEEQILALEQERIKTLRTLAAALEEAAVATGDPEKIAAAREFAAGIREIEYSLEAAANAFSIFAEVAIEAGTYALTEFFDTGLEGAGNLKDAFRDMVTSIVGSLRRLAAELLAVYIMQKLTGLFGASAGGGGGGGGGGSVLVAGGGLVRGPGTGTSDSIRARISDWEFITRAAVVRQPGVLEHLRELNREGARALGATPHVVQVPAARFAGGGLVEAGGSSGEVLNGQLSIGLEDGLVLREMETPEGQRVLVNSVSENRRAIRAALGL